MFGFGKNIKLSVIIPIHNTEEYLRECVDSVRTALDGIDAEIIMVDDGSSDRSGEIADEYAASNEILKSFHTEAKGPGAARNFGKQHANGEYIAFVDSDDFVSSNIYKNMLASAEFEKCDMVVCDVIRKDGSKYIHSELHRKAFHQLRSGEIDIRKDMDLIFDGTSVNRIIRRAFFNKHKIQFPEGVFYEDVATIQRLYCLAKRVRLVRQWGYCWRIRAGSISQRQFDCKNVVDRMAMLERMKTMAEELNMPSNYARMIDYKILALEFNGFIGVLHTLTEEEANEYLEIIASFIEKTVSMDVVSDLSLYDRQKVEYILKRDADGLIRLLNYKKSNYMNAPVTETESGYEMRLPETLFSVSSGNMKNEFNNTPYWVSIDSVERSESVVTVHTHAYIRRINMPELSNQDVKAFLINDVSGEELELKVTKEKRPSLTEARGTVLNYDDYRYYHYNYDGTGIAIEIDINTFAGDESFSGWNYIMLESSNKLGNKNQILRFATKKALDTINDIVMQTEQSTVSFSTDEIQVFGIDVKSFIQ